MKKIGYILLREYLTRVRKKSFLLLTLLLPVLIGLFMVAMIVIATQAQEELRIAVKDESGLFEDKFRGLDQGEKLRFEYLTNNPQPLDTILQHYESAGYDGVLYIPAIDLDRPLGFTYYASSEIGLVTEERIEKAISEEIRKRVLERENYNTDIIDKLDKNIDITKVINNEKQDGSAELAAGFGYACGLLIYLFLIVYGAMVMKSVTEEKTNRIVEVLVTTVKPYELMIGKILGIGAVGLTQFVLWGALTMAVQTFIGILLGDQLAAVQTMQAGNGMADASKSTQIIADISTAFQALDLPRILFSFVFYFIFGYIFYASQFAAIGAAMTDDSDAQSFTFPITIPIIISMVLMSVTLEQPFSAAAYWGSMLPFSSPIIMITRIPFQVPWWEQIVSMLILLVSALAMVYVAAKIYRVGILVQGKKITFKEITKWIFYK
ncbi:MAG TPA: ABC transporter permease [Chitinophagales bacterium]|nr:ABC transporter permease [Chitinophagales bacterium]